MASELVLIVWKDAVEREPGWRSTAETTSEVHLCHTVGFLVNEDADAVTIASTISEADGGEENIGRFSIPRGMIVDMAPFAFDLRTVRVVKFQEGED